MGLLLLLDTQSWFWTCLVACHPRNTCWLFVLHPCPCTRKREHPGGPCTKGASWRLQTACLLCRRRGCRGRWVLGLSCLHCHTRRDRRSCCCTRRTRRCRSAASKLTS